MATPEEVFKFTIDTRLLDNLDTDPNHFGGTATTFLIPCTGRVNDIAASYSWVINWGDGTALQTANGSSDRIQHNYSTPGRYQITIRPNTATPAYGWFNAFGFISSGVYANEQANKNMLLSLDSPMPRLGRTKGGKNLFNEMFYGTYNNERIPANFFSLLDTSGVTNFNRMFRSTFNRSMYNVTSATIPAGLFNAIDTTNATDISSMFEMTFSHTAYNSLSATIPRGLFDALDTSGVTNMDTTFYYAFNRYGSESKRAVIPPDIFHTINTSKAVDMTSAFNGTFSGYMYSNPAGIIPAGLFDSINTSRATSLKYAFASTFYVCAYKSLVATIPAGLFDFLDLRSGPEVTNIFYCTFRECAVNSLVAKIPDNLFTNLDLTTATAVNGIFNRAFEQFAYENRTLTTDINNIWGNANFAGKITPENAGGTYGNMSDAFWNMRSLTGQAQTFINNKLGGISPAQATRCFVGTGVTDRTSLHANWR